MPIYPYSCPMGHEFEVVTSISEHLPVRPCPDHGGDSPQIFCAPGLNGVSYSEATRKLLSVPYGRKRANGIRDIKDIQRLDNEFARKFPHLGKPEAK